MLEERSTVRVGSKEGRGARSDRDGSLCVTFEILSRGPDASLAGRDAIWGLGLSPRSRRRRAWLEKEVIGDEGRRALPPRARYPAVRGATELLGRL